MVLCLFNTVRIIRSPRVGPVKWRVPCKSLQTFAKIKGVTPYYPPSYDDRRPHIFGPYDDL